MTSPPLPHSPHLDTPSKAAQMLKRGKRPCEPSGQKFSLGSNQRGGGEEERNTPRLACGEVGLGHLLLPALGLWSSRSAFLGLAFSTCEMFIIIPALLLHRAMEGGIRAQTGCGNGMAEPWVDSTSPRTREEGERNESGQGLPPARCQQPPCPRVGPNLYPLSPQLSANCHFLPRRQAGS